VIRRAWKAGDVVQLELPMPVRRVYAHEKSNTISAAWPSSAAHRVLCGRCDNSGQALNLVLPDDSRFAAEHRATCWAA